MSSRYRHALYLAMLVPLMSGCEKSAKDKLQGEWDGVSIENCPVTELQRATGWVKGTAMIFNGAKVKVVIPAESPRTGSFKIAKTEGDKMTIAFTRDEGGHDEAELQLVGERELRWKIGGGREIVMVKKN